MVEHSRLDTYNTIVNIIAEKLNIDKSTISGSATLEQLGADSLDMVEIIMKLEEQFDIEIDDEEAESFGVLDQVVDYVHRLRS
jgi:acyl carrier protein